MRAEQGAAAGRLRVLPVGEEDAGGATNPQLQQLPLLAHPAHGARPRWLPLQHRRGYPDPRQRLVALVPGLRRAHRVPERPD